MRPLKIFTCALMLLPLSGPLSAMEVPTFTPEGASAKINNEFQNLTPTDQRYLRPALARVSKAITPQSPIHDSCILALISRVKEGFYREGHKKWCEDITQADDFVYRGIKCTYDFTEVVCNPSINMLKQTSQTIYESDYFKSATHLLPVAPPILESMGAIEIYYLTTLSEPTENTSLDSLLAARTLIQDRWAHLPFREVRRPLGEIIVKYDLTIEFVNRMAPLFGELMRSTPNMRKVDIYECFLTLIYNLHPRSITLAVNSLDSLAEESSQATCLLPPISLRELRQSGVNYDLLKRKKGLIAKKAELEASTKTLEDQAREINVELSRAFYSRTHEVSSTK